MADLHESTGTYAVDAVDGAELAEFEAHLAGCLTCRNEVAELSEAGVELALLSLATPPAGLRDRILDVIRTTPQLPAHPLATPSAPLAASNGSRPAAAVRPGGPRRALPGTEGPEEPEQPTTDEVARHRQRRRSRIGGALVAALLALTVGLGGVVYALVPQRQTQVASIPLEQQLYAAPDVVLTTTDLKGGGQATFVVSRQLNRALFLGTDLPDPGRDRRYQLWTMSGPEPRWAVATGVTRDAQIPDRGPAVKAFFDGDVAGADWLCVSLEPEDNTSNQPTVPPAGAAEV